MLTKIILALVAGVLVALWLMAFEYFSDDHLRAAFLVFSVIGAGVTTCRRKPQAH